MPAASPHTSSSTLDPLAIVMRSPDVTDAAAMHRIVREDGGLDLNSVYCYLLICSHFAGTSLVAEGQAGLAGFVAAYRQPAQPETLFVWQIGVAAGRRSKELAAGCSGHSGPCRPAAEPGFSRRP